MTVGLQIWNKQVGSDEPSINITDRCTSIVGTQDMGYWAGLLYDKDDIFNWKSITVPEFSFGEPFWSFKNNVRNKVQQLANAELITDSWFIQYGWASDYISIEPEVYVEGDILYYRYPPGAQWAPGDYSYWSIGGHIMFYGVC